MNRIVGKIGAHVRGNLGKFKALDPRKLARKGRSRKGRK
jgi:hypothetical protein